MFTISWHFKPHKVTLWHWCMASATQGFGKAHATLSFRCAPAYAISTWKNIANKTDASPGVFLRGNQIWIGSMASVLPSAMAALCAVSNKGSIWDNDGCAVHGEVPSLQHMGCPGVCGVLLTWGTRGPGESCTSCPGRHGIPLPWMQPHGLHALQEHVDGSGQFVYFSLLRVHYSVGSLAHRWRWKRWNLIPINAVNTDWGGRESEMELICIRNCFFDTVMLSL